MTIPRSARISIQTFGICAALAVLMVAEAGTARVAAGAGLPARLAHMQTAVAAARGYRAVMVTTSPEVSQHSVIVVVRHGSLLERYADMTVSGPSGMTSEVEMVVAGPRFCQRLRHSGAYHCLTSGGVSRLLGTDPSTLLQKLDLVYREVPGSPRQVQGQLCLGYTYVSSTAFAGLHTTTRGTLWVAQTTSLPVQEDTVTTMTQGAGAPHVTTVKIVWSRWNDPSLAIPALPPQ